MAYISNEQYNDQSNLRDMIEGELNRIAVTDDHSEIDKMLAYLQDNIQRFAQKHHDRINGIYSPETIHTVDTVSVDVIAMTDNFIFRKTDEAPSLFNRILSLKNPCFKSIYDIIFFLIEENLLNM